MDNQSFIKNNPPLKKGVDYYIENGKWVFTEKFLSKRGYCCQSGCRHCPYGFKRDEAAKQERDS